MNSQNHNSMIYNSISQILDNNLDKFYSSRTGMSQSSQSCSCKFTKIEKEEQLAYYTIQKSMINEARSKLTQTQRTHDEKMISQLLNMVIDYIDKIVQLLHQDYLCPCKKLLLSCAEVNQHKMQFIRDKNDKFFQLYEEKSEECDFLKKKVQQLEKKERNSFPDISPFTQILIPMGNKENKQISTVMNMVSEQSNAKLKESTYSSKISQSQDAVNPQIKSVIIQQEHDIYFKQNEKQKIKKNRIFKQLHENKIRG